jgi:hypothetical protein
MLVEARGGGGDRGSAYGGANGCDGTDCTLTGGGGSSLKGGDGHSQVGRSNVEGDRSDGDHVDGHRGRHGRNNIAGLDLGQVVAVGLELGHAGSGQAGVGGAGWTGVAAGRTGSTVGRAGVIEEQRPMREWSDPGASLE